MKRKAKICKQCGKEYSPMNSLQVVCSYLCSLKFNSEKEVNKRIKEYKVSSQKLSELEAIARKIFQAYIRKRDENLPCISCGKTNATQWDGSHYYKAEIWSGLIFDEMNCNKSCSYCNKELHGNLIEYRKGLIKKYGELAVEGFEEQADQHRQFKYTREMYLEIIKTYKQKIKDFK